MTAFKEWRGTNEYNIMKIRFGYRSTCGKVVNTNTIAYNSIDALKASFKDSITPIVSINGRKLTKPVGDMIGAKQRTREDKLLNKALGSFVE